MSRYGIVIASLLTLSFPEWQDSVTFAEDTQAIAAVALFASEESILDDNGFRIVERTADLRAEERFAQLADWVLPSPTHSGFRMNAEFLQTDPVPGSLDRVAEATCEGILSPCIALVRTAQQTGKLDELRRRIEAIPDPVEPHQQRAKLAILMMLQSARNNENAALELCSQLSRQVRVRGENLNGRWWPETLALARGMQHMQDRSELLELAVIGPIPLHCLLRAGVVGKKSKELLKSSVVRAEVYNHFSRFCSQ